MKKRWLFAVVILVTLACNIPTTVPVAPSPQAGEPTVQAGAPTITPQPEALFSRAPVEAMNVTQADLPGFQEVPAEPVEAPLAAETVAQDQKSFERPQQEARVDSAVFLLRREPDDGMIQTIFEQVRKRGKICAESCGPLGDYSGENPLASGERGALRWIDAACGKAYVAVIVRGNYVTVITGCGQGVDEAFLALLSSVVDGRVVALSGGDGEVTPTPGGVPTKAPFPYPLPTLSVYPPPLVTATPDNKIDCVALNLTPEECVNAGPLGHDYILVSTVTWVVGSNQSEVKPNQTVHATWPFPTPMDNLKQCIGWKLEQKNTYWCKDAATSMIYQIIFRLDGFLAVRERKERGQEVSQRIVDTYVFATPSK